MAKKDWIAKEIFSAHKDYQHKSKKIGIHIGKRYPSGTWDIEVYDERGMVIFDEFPQYELTEKEANKKLLKFMMEN